MNVEQLIAALKTMPQDAKVLQLWDGDPHSSIEHIWLAHDGDVVMLGDSAPDEYTIGDKRKTA